LFNRQAARLRTLQYLFDKMRSLTKLLYISGVGYPQLEAAFIEELEKFGFSEGQNIFIERRFSRPNTTDA